MSKTIYQCVDRKLLLNFSLINIIDDNTEINSIHSIAH